MTSSISSFEIIGVVNPGQTIFLWIAASVADAAVNPNVIKKLFANGLSTFPIKDNPYFRNSPNILLQNPAGCPILCNWDFNNFELTKELFAKALQSL